MSTEFRDCLVRTIRPYVKYFDQLSKPVMRALIQVSVHYIETSKCSPEVVDLALKKLTQTGNQIPENFCELFAAVLQIMQIFLRTTPGTVKQDELRYCLKMDLRLKDECVDDLSKVLNTHHLPLSRSFLEAHTIRCTAKNLQWRINLSLTQPPSSKTGNRTVSKPSTSSTDSIESNAKRESSSLPPTVLLHFQLSEGNSRDRTLELSLAMFHRLRYNVALLLSEMQSLEQRAIMKKF